MGKGIGKIIHSDRTFYIIANFLGGVIVLIVLSRLFLCWQPLFRIRIWS